MATRCHSLAYLATFSLLTLGGTALGLTPYTIIDLGSFNIGGSIQASDISNSGVVVGGEFFSTTATAFRWDGALHALPPLAGESTSGAEGINDLGRIVGDSVTNGNPRAVIWQNDVPTLLPVTGTRSNATDINNPGDVVGTNRVSSRDRAFLLENGAVASIDLGTLGGLEAQAFAINDAGLVVGSAETANRNDHAFIWRDINGNHQSDAGEMVQLSDLGLSSAANAINEQNYAAGFVLRPSFTRQAALWDSNRVRIDLPNLPGALDGEIFDLNAGLQSVGKSGNSAALWEGSSVFKLADLIPANSGWVSLIVAYGINDAGEIVGFGRRDGTGNDHAFLLRPVPEPTTALAGLAVTFALLASRRRRRVVC